MPPAGKGARQEEHFCPVCAESDAERPEPSSSDREIVLVIPLRATGCASRISLRRSAVDPHQVASTNGDRRRQAGSSSKTTRTLTTSAGFLTRSTCIHWLLITSFPSGARTKPRRAMFSGCLWLNHFQSFAQPRDSRGQGQRRQLLYRRLVGRKPRQAKDNGLDFIAHHFLDTSDGRFKRSIWAAHLGQRPDVKAPLEAVGTATGRARPRASYASFVPEGGVAASPSALLRRLVTAQCSTSLVRTSSARPT